MSSSQSTIDRICLDLVDEDLSNALYWYVISVQSKRKYGTTVLSDSIEDHLKKKILLHKNEFLIHPYAEYIVVNEYDTDLSIVGYPPRLKENAKNLMNLKQNCERNKNDV